MSPLSFHRKRTISAVNHRSGFLLLTAILISTVVLSVGISMASIAYKELTLSITARDSMFAFYAADAGAECASYWDIRGDNIFPATNNDITYTPKEDAVYCNAQDISDGRNGIADWGVSNPVFVETAPNDIESAETKFSFGLAGGNQSDPCVEVSIKKVWDDGRAPAGIENDEVDPGEVLTTITSNGFSSCDSGNLRRVQRTLEQTY